MAHLRQARLRRTITTLHPRLLAVIAGLRLMAPLQALRLRHPNYTVVTHHPTHHHLPSRRLSRVLLQVSQADMAMERVAMERVAMERLALHRPSQVPPQASQVALAMEPVALHHPSQARARPSLAVATDLPQDRLGDTDPHKGLLLLMEAALAFLTVLVDLAVILLLVHLRSGSQVRNPTAHHLAGRSSLVRLEVGRRSLMVVVVAVGGKATCVVWLQTEI